MTMYPARISGGADGYVVTFRDIPEAITQGFSLEEALTNAEDALATAMDFYFEDRREVPEPSPRKRGETYVTLRPSVGTKVLLLNEMLRQKVTAADLARRLHTTPQAVNRIVDLDHSTKIDTLAEALNAVGKRLVLTLEPA